MPVEKLVGNSHTQLRARQQGLEIRLYAVAGCISSQGAHRLITGTLTPRVKWLGREITSHFHLVLV
jgi:hypothetical protein